MADKGLLPSHLLPDTDLRSQSIFRLRMRYLTIFNNVVQEVLAALRDEVWPSRGRDDFGAKFEGWCEDYRLRDQWIREAAIFTMDVWTEAGVPEWPCWEPDPIRSAILLPLHELHSFRFSGLWYPDETPEQMSQRLTELFKVQLAEYVTEVKTRLASGGGGPPTQRRGRRGRTADTYREWCALYQSGWLLYDEIAKIDGVTEDDVGRRVREVAREIGLTLPPRGAGRRRFKQRNRREKRT